MVQVVDDAEIVLKEYSEEVRFPARLSRPNCGEEQDWFLYACLYIWQSSMSVLAEFVRKGLLGSPADIDWNWTKGIDTWSPDCVVYVTCINISYCSFLLPGFVINLALFSINMTHSNTYIVFLNVLHMNVPTDENHNMRHKSALAGHFLGENEWIL